MLKNNIDELIIREKLQKHEEGGYFCLTYISDKVINVPAKYAGGERSEASKINYLLVGNDFSAWHRLKSDETWRYKEGTSLMLHIIQKSGKLLQIKIGDPSIELDAVHEYCVENNQWFAASVNDTKSFSYVECEVRPGFDYRDWQLGNKEYLTKRYPQHTLDIEKYSRDQPVIITDAYAQCNF